MHLNQDNLDKYIDFAYNKALYETRVDLVCDNIELKYIEANYPTIKEYIKNVLQNKVTNAKYSHQYKIIKASGGYRGFYVDDFINDVISVLLVISNGLDVEKFIKDDVSFGNRLEYDLNKPYVFQPYFDKYYNQFKTSKLELTFSYKYYYKLDIEKCYNSIPHDKLKLLLNRFDDFDEDWIKNKIDAFLDKDMVECKVGHGVQQNSSLGHLLANIYLSKFDYFFSRNFKDSKLIRYVDDMIIFTHNKSRCDEIVKKCKDYLENQLELKLNVNKCEEGSTLNLLDTKDDEFFNTSNSIALKILRTLYRLDDENYKNFVYNKDSFLSSYSSCLSELGVNLSAEWLNIKICNEKKTSDKIDSIFANKDAMNEWIDRKEIYELNVNLGLVPLNNSKTEINQWVKNFKKNNPYFINEILFLRRAFGNKLNDLIDLINNDNDNISLYKSEINYTINKIAVFKCSSIERLIPLLSGPLSYLNKKFLANYKEGIYFALSNVENIEQRLDSYNSLISIWLLGEYKYEKAVSMLEELFINTLYDNYYVNTLVAEALLKIDDFSLNFIKLLKYETITLTDYFPLRNSLSLLNYVSDISNIISKLNIQKLDCRTKNFISWIQNNHGCNILNIHDKINELFKASYPDVPTSVVEYPGIR